MKLVFSRGAAASAWLERIALRGNVHREHSHFLTGHPVPSASLRLGGWVHVQMACPAEGFAFGYTVESQILKDWDWIY
jgi:hypothetical protein